ncbi:MAG: hypothetical protein K2Q20_02475, partial [Phycisphaerales bacterium]|nr:hypothetical protein [Phycisphaerales bacterium]
MTLTPLCPTCRYDLSATPDGRCPECGNAFTRAHLAAAADERTDRLTGVMAAVSLGQLVVTTAAAGSLGGGPLRVGAALLACSWLVACWVAWTNRRVAPHDFPLGVIGIFSWILLLIVMSNTARRPAPEWAGV